MSEVYELKGITCYELAKLFQRTHYLHYDSYIG